MASALDELIPKYRSVESPPVKDILDTYIEHRQLLEGRLHPDPAEVSLNSQGTNPKKSKIFKKKIKTLVKNINVG